MTTTDMIGRIVHFIHLHPETRSADLTEGVVHGITYDAKEGVWYLLVQPFDDGARMVNLDHRQARLSGIPDHTPKEYKPF